MSYHDHRCVCGQTKPTDTLLCDACAERADPGDARIYGSPGTYHTTQRRNAAIRLLADARRWRLAQRGAQR
jgi:hypothetical protein